MYALADCNNFFVSCERLFRLFLGFDVAHPTLCRFIFFVHTEFGIFVEIDRVGTDNILAVRLDFGQNTFIDSTG